MYVAAATEISATSSSLTLAISVSGHVAADDVVASAIVAGAAVVPSWAGAVELGVAFSASRLACNASFRVRIGDGERRPVLLVVRSESPVARWSVARGVKKLSVNISVAAPSPDAVVVYPWTIGVPGGAWSSLPSPSSSMSVGTEGPSPGVPL